MVKWKNASFDMMFDDAMLGDSAALQMIGECNLYGLSGCTIDVKLANRFFAAAASLGFPPAIDKIRGMYTEKNDPFLMLIYTNLTASYNHTEYTLGYHELRDHLVEQFGSSIAEEIERIASNKKEAIYKNIETLKKLHVSDERQRFVLELFAAEGILMEDSKFDSEYWYNIFNNSHKKT